MHLRTAIQTTLPALLFSALLGCGSSGNGTMNVHLVDAPGDYAKIMLDVKRVELHGPTGWLPLSSAEHTIDLLTLVNGVTDPVATQVSLTPGHYDQIRLVLGDLNSVYVLGGAKEPLVVPSGMKSGVKVNVNLDISADTTTDLYLDFDGHRSVFLHTTGSGKYMLRPVVRAVVRQGSGLITGTVANDATAPELLSGVNVTAQTIDGNGVPTIVRSVKTDATGHFTLDLLPVNVPCYVVAQVGPAATIITTTNLTPVSGNYGAAASAPITATPAPGSAVDLTVAAVGADAADISGTIGPSTAGESDADVVTARQPLVPGVELIVRNVTAIVDTGEHYDLGLMPVGDYEIAVTRLTLDATTSDITAVSSPAVSVNVTGGTPAVANLTLP